VVTSHVDHLLMLVCVLGVITLALAVDLVVVLSWLRPRLHDHAQNRSHTVLWDRMLAALNNLQ